MKIVYCPHCGDICNCRHFVGWTDDGKIIEPHPSRLNQEREPINPATDSIVLTGVSARVYRKFPESS